MLMTLEKDADLVSIKETKKIQPVKCVVWDLDNTLWDGVLVEGDDVLLKNNIRETIIALDSRGVLQSIASKNNFDDAIKKLEEFGLREYFLYPQINWNAKSSSLDIIQKKLNIGIDTFLFIDDQPFEREEVNAVHKLVECIDALEYESLLELPRLKLTKVADDAAQRRIRYLEDMERQKSEEEFVGTPETFLASLDMIFTIAKANDDDLLRAEELTLRTNQLNSTGITYSAEELAGFMESENFGLFVCELSDKFGSYGKIGLALVEYQENVESIKLLLMSCRTVARGVGGVLLSFLMKGAKSRNKILQAQFRRTDRNRQMLVTYQFSGFREMTRDESGNILFEHDLAVIQDYPVYINVIHA